jgi:hypothetical protein
MARILALWDVELWRQAVTNRPKESSAFISKCNGALEDEVSSFLRNDGIC